MRPWRCRIDGACLFRDGSDAADVDLLLRALEDREAGAAQQRLDGRAVRDPPVRLILRIAFLDEMQAREEALLEDRRLRDRVVLGDRSDLAAAAQHRLEDEEVPRGMLADEIEREQRIAQMVEDAHEENDVEALAEGSHVVDR